MPFGCALLALIASTRATPRVHSSLGIGEIEPRRSDARAPELDDAASIADPRLVVSARVVSKLSGSGARYFSVVDMSRARAFARAEGELWLFARGGQGQRTSHEEVWTNATVESFARVEPRAFVQCANLAHNFGVTLTRGHKLIGAGGMFVRDWKKTAALLASTAKHRGADPNKLKLQLIPSFPVDGIWMFEARNRSEVLSGRWTSPGRNVSQPIPGDHAGCVEEREHFGGACAFDGRFSLTQHRGMLFLYARANTLFEGGGRFVQVTRSASARGPWSPFQLLRVEGYDTSAIARGNVYFAAVNTNPADPSTLLGVFPVLLDRDASISMALSCDGVHFGNLTRVLRSREAQGGRTTDHPVDGFVRRGGLVYWYAHRDVPGIRPTGGGPAVANQRIVQFAIPIEALREYTARARAALQRRGHCGPPGDSR